MPKSASNRSATALPGPGRHWKDAAALGLRAHSLSQRLSALSQDIERDLWDLRNELAGLAFELSTQTQHAGPGAAPPFSDVAKKLESAARDIDRGGPLGRAQDLHALTALAQEMFRGRGHVPRCSVAEATHLAIPLVQRQQAVPLLIQEIADHEVSLDLADLVGALVQLLLWLGGGPASRTMLSVHAQALDLWVEMTLRRRLHPGRRGSRAVARSPDLADDHLVTALIPLSAAGARLVFGDGPPEHLSLQLLLPRSSNEAQI